MEVSAEIVRQEIVDICKKFNWQISPRPFQIDFFVKAVVGLSGFLEVQDFAGTNLLFIFSIFKAPCGSGKSMLYQLLPFILKTFR
jgi:hypothetical protein